ncbi:MAG: flagellar filament capping protein FliD [Eubacterium sp.]|nr:flagellar filament capping protein FliD [Eubacterium sp.]
MATIENAYSYFLQTYGQTSGAQYETHKKSELRNVYNSIVKLNKESPIFKLTNPSSAQKFAIDMKEASTSISRVLSSISEDPTDAAFDFRQKIATSSNFDVVDVTYNNEASDEPPAVSNFELEVKKLAEPQINRGNFVTEAERGLPTGDFAFEVETNGTVFEFQFTVHSEDNNLGIMNRLSRLINNSKIGIKAETISDGEGKVALELQSTRTGAAEGVDRLFNISSDNTYNSEVFMSRYGLNKTEQFPSNSLFTLNGEERTSQANNFTINKVFEVHLLEETPEDEPVTIGFKSDVDAIADNVKSLTDAYNELVKVAEKYTNDEPPSTKLYNMIGNIATRNKESLSSVGLEVNDDYTISVNKEMLTEAAQPENWMDTHSKLSSFRNSIENLSNRTSLNPMDFVDKKIVEYKNPGKNLTAPYVTSQYAGMMFNAYL